MKFTVVNDQVSKLCKRRSCCVRISFSNFSSVILKFLKLKIKEDEHISIIS